VRQSLTALAAVLGVPFMILASAGVTAAPHAAAQPSGCPNPNQTTAYVDYSWTSNNIGVWVACVPFTNVTHDCYAPANLAAPKLYRRGEGPAPECRNIYNSR
jgi:hypothetical protein